MGDGFRFGDSGGRTYRHHRRTEDGAGTSDRGRVVGFTPMSRLYWDESREVTEGTVSSGLSLGVRVVLDGVLDRLESNRVGGVERDDVGEPGEPTQGFEWFVKGRSLGNCRGKGDGSRKGGPQTDRGRESGSRESIL